MNLSTDTHGRNHATKENISTSSAINASQARRAKKRKVLGVLSENEQRGRSLSHGNRFSKHSLISDSSQLTCPGCTSSSSIDVYVEETREIAHGASCQKVVSDSSNLDAELAPLQNEDSRLLLVLNTCSRKDAAVPSEPDEPLMSGVVLHVSEYTEDIYWHLRQSEMDFRPKPDYLQKHPEITSGMRVVLVDWLVEVVKEYKLHAETLHLAVNYLDRFLSCTTNVKRGKLQLVGTAALLIATKYEAISPPELNEFVYITDRAYTRKQLIWMEQFFLRVLAFKMAAPTANQFLRLFMSIYSVCGKTKNLALYLAELSLLEVDPFLQYTPSVVAAGAYCLANYTVNQALWPNSLHGFTGYSVDELVPCLTDLHKLYIAAESHSQQEIRKKYKSLKYCSVSSITPPAVLPFYESSVHSSFDASA